MSPEAGKRSAGRRTIPDVLNPDESMCCAHDDAVVKAEPGGRTLYFHSIPDAEQAFGGPIKSQRIKNATAPNPRQKDPYGWKWTRLVDLRNGGYRLAQP
jgi:hypothetical protein